MTASDRMFQQARQARTSDSDREAGLVLSGERLPVGEENPAEKLSPAEGQGAQPQHAFRVLEFPRVLELVSGHAASEAGAARVRALLPMDAPELIAAEHARVEAMRALVTSEGGWRPEAIPMLAQPLQRLRVPGTSWTGPELRAAVTLLVSSRLTRSALTDQARDAAIRDPLAPLARALVVDASMEREIDRVIAEDGMVRDGASPSLRRIRKELRGSESELVRLLERLMAKLDSRFRVDDASVTMRNGRYVIPVRREGRSQVGGIVHDTSASGITVFVEPPAAVEAGNRIRELETEEMREVERILLEATDLLRPRRDDLLATLEALAALDALYARARYALAFACAPVALADGGGGFTIVNGRHPLLLSRDAAAVVPFDLVMHGDEHTLLVSGPNTGGKTVLLKALALISLMVQSGIPAPVGPGSRVGLFDRFFADIGDEQSIEASLSTFSAHLRNLTEIVRDSTARSLVLIDELGSGTDPLEGAALGGAILEELTLRGTTTIATTHLGALKELAQEVSGVVNASLQFDAVALAPTYRLVKGIPGRSYGLSIARRLAMPEEVLQNAERRVPTGERDVAALIADLERRGASLAEREREVAGDGESNRERASRLLEREKAVREKERELERVARQEARRYLLEARHDIERTIKELKAAGAGQIEEAAVSARRAAERRAADENAALERLDEAVRREVEAESSLAGTVPGGIEIGASVAVASLAGKTGRVVELRGTDAVVMVGAVKVTVARATLRRVSKRALEPAATAVPIMGDLPDEEVRTEVDVRGMRVGEVDDAIVQALDAAVRVDLKSLRIIHGKGTGALRERVSELLRMDRRVRGFRLGAWNEGGAGVTFAELA